MSKFAARLRELRESREWSQSDLAKKLNTSRSRISMYEQGKRQPDFEMQEAIADLFNVNLDYLFDRDGFTTPLTENEQILIEMIRSHDDSYLNNIMKYAEFIAENTNIPGGMRSGDEVIRKLSIE